MISSARRAVSLSRQIELGDPPLPFGAPELDDYIDGLADVFPYLGEGRRCASLQHLGMDGRDRSAMAGVDCPLRLWPSKTNCCHIVRQRKSSKCLRHNPLERPVQGCRTTPLGSLRYQATASPQFVARYFPEGVTEEALENAPALTFNQKDRLQTAWAQQVFSSDMSFATHWLPSTQSFVEGCLAGMGWALNPVQLTKEHVARGNLVELIPGKVLERRLFWQINRLAADQLTELTANILSVAQRELF